MTASSTNEPLTLRVLDIMPGTSVDGPGLRTSIYLAGCAHACPGCHNPQSWDFGGGREMTVGELMEVIAENEEDVTLTGGDPLYQARVVAALCREIKNRLGYDIWIYSGFTYEEAMADSVLSEPLLTADVMVDGPFVMSRRDTSLRFRGSDNQRMIDLRRSTPGAPVIWQD